MRRGVGVPATLDPVDRPELPRSDYVEVDNDPQSLRGFVARIDETRGEISRLGLERHAAELMTLGFTVIEPERIGAREVIDGLLHATLEVARRRRSVDYEITDGTPELRLGHGDKDKEANETFILLESDKYLLFEDRVFEPVVLQESVLALVSLLLGPRCILNRFYSLYRHAGTPPLPLHTDCLHPSPFPPFSTLAAVTWCLTDFEGEVDGATCYVPGTQRFSRRPTKYEGFSGMAHARNVEAPAGSVLVHDGAVWHGAPTRQTAGLRVSLHQFYTRGAYPQSEGYRGNEPDGFLARNPPRLAHLLGHGLSYPHYADGYDLETRASGIDTMIAL